MARMPQAQWLGEHSPRRDMDRYDILCVHTIVGFAPAHAAHFSTHQGGTIQQSRDTRYQSGANLDGNHRVIAIENEDHGSEFPAFSGNDVPPLTDDQVEANAQIFVWAHQEHGIPLQLCPNSKPGSRGLAYHRQGIDGNFGSYDFPGRVSGGEVWTLHFGKGCPGDERIRQLPAILARAKEIVRGVERDWFDMADKADLKAAVREVLREPLVTRYDHTTGEAADERVSVLTMLYYTHKRAVEAYIVARRIQGVSPEDLAEELNRLDTQAIAEAVANENAERMKE